MKKITPLFLLICLLYSCSVEKRHYRNGWYIDHVNRAENWLDAQRNYSIPKSDTVVSAATKTDSIVVPPSDSKTTIAGPELKTIPADTNFQSEKVQQNSSSNPLPRMSHVEILTRMREQGCTPHPFANTLYILSIAAIPLTFVTGIGFFLAIAVLILSFFAEQTVIASGGCVEENLALIRLARRNSLILLILIVLLTFLLVALITGLFGLWF